MFFGYGALLATIMAACLIVIAWRCLDFGSARKLQKMKVTTHEPVTLPGGSWRFIVSGDSRNCGDVVMPAICCPQRPVCSKLLLAPGRPARNLQDRRRHGLRSREPRSGFNL